MLDQNDMPKRPSGQMIRWLWRGYLRARWGWLAVAVLLMVIEGATFGSLSYMMQPMFDDVFVGGQTSSIWFVALAVFAIFMIRAVTALCQKVIMKNVAEKCAAAMRKDLMGHLMELDSSFHQTNPPGQLIERVQGDVQSLSGIWTALITGVARDLVAVIGLFSVAAFIDWRWMMIALVGIPIVVLPSFALQTFVRAKARAAREVSADMSTRLDEVFHGIAQIKLNNLEAYQSRRYDRLMGRRVRAETQATVGQGLMSSTVDLMAGLGFVAVIVYGGAEIIEGEKTVGQFMAFFTAMGIAFDPLRRLANIAGLWQAAAAAIDRILDLFDEKPTLLSPASPVAVTTAAPQIRFQDVALSYGDLPVLNNATFTAEAGQTTALVGASGAGKSTLFNVLTRLVEPQSGAVTLDGTAINTLALQDLRALVSTVSQDAALFDETLRDNILLGRQDVPEGVLDKTLKDAHVADFLPDLAQGLDSSAGPRGSNLSGGQRQRVAIARALLRNTPILLLDEATSALDTKSEAIVQSALERLSQGRTTLVIAHRLSTIKNAHKIVVMDKGHVVDEGTHDDLLARGGLYADLYKLQFRDGKQVIETGNTAGQAPTKGRAPASHQSWLSRVATLLKREVS